MTTTKELEKKVNHLTDLISKLVDNKAEAKPEMKADTKQKKLISSQDRKSLLDKLTINEKIELWGEITPDNLFSGRYSTARKLYKKFNVDGRPSLPYSQAWDIIESICAEHKKYTAKQMKQLSQKAVAQLETKKSSTPNNKSAEWIDKAINHIKGN